MNIQRWDIGVNSEDGYMDVYSDGGYVEYEDHVKAMKEQEGRTLRFAEWFRFDCMDEDKNLPNFNTAKEAFAYWSSQDKDESNPNRKYL